MSTITESNAMSDRILRDIQNIINNDREIEEFTIIPTAENVTNKSPILYRDHNIGLESWCVKHIYQYSCSGLFYYRPKLATKKVPFHLIDQINRLLMGALLITPENHTFWNMRRELVEMDILNVEEELYFSGIVLSQKSKTNEVFSYRRWLLGRLKNKFVYNNLEIPSHRIDTELYIVHRASEKAPNNYHSWNHLMWCIENLVDKTSNFQDTLFAELNYSQQWINEHVSEHSGYQYRQYLIQLLPNQKCFTVFDSFYAFVIKNVIQVEENSDCGQLLNYLLGESGETRSASETISMVNYICVLLYDLNILNHQLNMLFPEHESLFYHRRFLVYHLLKLISEHVPCSSNGVQNLTSAVDLNQCPKLFKMSNVVLDCELYRIVTEVDEKFCDENHSVVQVAKYKTWFNKIIAKV